MENQEGIPDYTKETEDTQGAAQDVSEGPADNEKSKKATIKKVKDKNFVKYLEFKGLPSGVEIYESIPEQGIEAKDLVSKFDRTIDDTNVSLFEKITREVAFLKQNTWFRKPRDQLPSIDVIDRIIENTRRIKPTPAPNPIQKDDVSIRRTSSVSNQETTITFSNTSEVMRKAAMFRPHNLYRFFSEETKTLCKYVSAGNYPKSRENPSKKLEYGAAFDSVGDFSIDSDLTTGRVNRHFKGRQKINPTSYISAFNTISKAKHRANYYARISNIVSERICIAEIDISDLVPATVTRSVEKTEKIFKRKAPGEKYELVRTITNTQAMNIPVWTNKSTAPGDESEMTLAQFEESDAEIWLSVAELMYSDLRIWHPKARAYEWLCADKIPEDRIRRVMPFDGYELHYHKSAKIIRSIRSTDPWVFSWKRSMWELDADKAEIADSQLNEQEKEWRRRVTQSKNKKRKRSTEDAGTKDSKKKR